MSSHGQPVQPAVLVPIKMPPALRKRFRLTAVEEELTYAQLIERLLDMRDDRLVRQRRAQAHPLHRPEEVTTL